MEKTTISGCIILDDEKILLLWKNKRDYYELPGGKQELGETLEEAAIRETKEEIGCDVEIIKKIDMTEFDFDQRRIISHKFLAKITKGTPKIMEHETFNEIFWMPLKDYKKYTLAPNVLDFCKRYEKGEFEEE
jgi:8-oxo-dGTP diphosphatase